jgi:hypothetical protein
MQLPRILLIVLMALVLFGMLTYPAKLDTKRRMVAVRNFLNSPNAQTKGEIEHARRLDQRDTLPFECVMTFVLGLCWACFLALGRVARDSRVAAQPIPAWINWAVGLILTIAIGLVLVLSLGVALRSWFTT